MMRPTLFLTLSLILVAALLAVSCGSTDVTRRSIEEMPEYTLLGSVDLPASDGEADVEIEFPEGKEAYLIVLVVQREPAMLSEVMVEFDDDGEESEWAVPCREVFGSDTRSVQFALPGAPRIIESIEITYELPAVAKGDSHLAVYAKDTPGLAGDAAEEEAAAAAADTRPAAEGEAEVDEDSPDGEDAEGEEED